MPSELQFRFATAEDVALVRAFICELAEYERLSHECVVTQEDLRQSLFSATPHAEVVLAYLKKEPVGFALFFHNYSTFLGKPGIYLEDLFVSPHARGKGVGKSLMRHLAKIAVERGCGRFEWAVLDWNEPSIEFYKSLGAVAKDEWTTMRVTGSALRQLASAEIF